MNANELANILETDSWYKLVTREEIATMLRQQQEQIDKLASVVALREIEIQSLKSVVYWLKENRPKVWDDIKKWSKL